MIVHLLEFRVVPGREAEVAAFLRRPPPADGHSAEIPVTCAGRRLGRQQSEYILTTVWRDAGTFERDIDQAGRPAYLAPKGELLTGGRSSAFHVLAAHWDNGFDGSRILRVYRGLVHASGMDEWRGRVVVQAPRLAASVGLRAVLIGTVLSRDGRDPAQAAAEPDPTDLMPVMAVSAWSDWNAVLTATSGHIDRPVLDTALEVLEKPSGVDHYQLLDAEPSPGEPPA